MSTSSQDPLPSERVYYRHVTTGELGYLVRRQGQEVVRYDRPAVDMTDDRLSNWRRDEDHRPLNANQVAQIAHAADLKLCFFLGIHGLKEWRDLSDQQRISFLHDGPKDSSPGRARTRLFLAITGAVSDLAR